jgi:hypothetical protein
MSVDRTLDQWLFGIRHKETGHWMNVSTLIQFYDVEWHEQFSEADKGFKSELERTKQRLVTHDDVDESKVEIVFIRHTERWIECGKEDV